MRGAERHGFEYIRNGTLSPYAALDTQTGEVQGKITARHTTQEFVVFLTDIVVRHPTYSSWLNQVELWFSKIERDLIYGGVFTSVEDLSRRIMKYIRKHNEDPQPIK